MWMAPTPIVIMDLHAFAQRIMRAFCVRNAFWQQTSDFQTFKRPCEISLFKDLYKKPLSYKVSSDLLRPIHSSCSVTDLAFDEIKRFPNAEKEN